MKCAGNHFTRECAKSRRSPRKCVNCGGHRVATYRNCTKASPPPSNSREICYAEALKVKNCKKYRKVIETSNNDGILNMLTSTYVCTNGILTKLIIAVFQPQKHN